MAFSLTRTARARTQGLSQEPALVLVIDGVSTIFGLGDISEYIKIGEPGLLIDGSWVIGGVGRVGDQLDLVSFDGTSTRIAQQLLQDKGGTSSVSSIAISLIDEDEEATRLISPGSVVTDVLGRKAQVYLGYRDSAYPQDYIQIFSGVIDEISTGGTVVLNIAHPEAKKRQEIWPAIATALTTTINSSATTIVLDDVGELLESTAGGERTSYIRIDDELIEVGVVNTGTNTITSCVRGQLGTTAAAHTAGADVSSLYRLQGQALDLTRKLLLSSPLEHYIEQVPVSAFVRIDPSTTVANAIFFEGYDVAVRYGVQVGDFMSTYLATDAVNNNVSLLEILSITTTDNGSYVVLDGATLTEETPTSAQCAFRSQWNRLGFGLGLGGDEVDLDEFDRIDTQFVGALPTYDFYLTETISGKEFIDTQLLFPANCYSLPRKGRVSLGFTSPPLAVAVLPRLTSANIIQPKTIRTKRSINRFLANTIVYAFAPDALEGKFRQGLVFRDEDSTTQIPVGTKALKIESLGLRADADTLAILRVNSRRFLDRYKFAAETFEVKTWFGDGFNVEVGDVVLFGDPDLPIADTKNATRGFQPRLCEVLNKSLDIKSGETALTLIDTNYLTGGRYGVFSPASTVGTGSTTTRIRIVDSFSTEFPTLEKDKWADYIGELVEVHSDDWSVREETTLIGFDPADPYVMIVGALGFTPSAGYTVDIPYYPTDTDPETNIVYKNVHCFSDPQVAVATGISALQFTVAAGPSGIGRFFVGSIVSVHNSDFSQTSENRTITDITGTTITVDDTLGFTPSSSHVVDLIGFAADEGDAYRYL